MYELVQLNVTRVSNGTSPWSADLLHRFGTLANPWEGMPGGNPFPFDWRETPLFLPASVVLPFDPDLNTPYTHNWNVSYQQELVGRWRVSASYLGNLGQRLWGMEALNPVLQPDAAVAREPVHRAEHLRPRGPDVHALQYGREPQSAAGAAAVGERERHARSSARTCSSFRTSTCGARIDRRSITGC